MHGLHPGPSVTTRCLRLDRTWTRPGWSTFGRVVRDSTSSGATCTRGVGLEVGPGQAERRTEAWFHGEGLHKTVQHHPLPEGRATMHRRSSVSRMRDNRTYGLKGGW